MRRRRASPFRGRALPRAGVGLGDQACLANAELADNAVGGGFLERNTTSVDIEAMVAKGAEMHPREAVQHLIPAILQATGGALNDDATALCLDWHGGPMRERTTDSGANQRPRPGVDN